MTDQASAHDIIHAKREAALKDKNIPEGLFVAACSAIGLACMFSGIWVGDGLSRTVMATSYSVLVMRVFTAAIYAVMLLVVFRVTKGKVVALPSFFAGPIAIGFACYLAGIGILLATPSIAGSAQTAAMWCALFLTKVIGAPLTIGLVCVFSQLTRMAALRSSAVGMLGAFLVYGAISQFGTAAGVSNIALALCSLALLAAAAIAGMLGMNKNSFGQVQYSTEDALGGNVVKRPIDEVVTKGFVVIVVLSAVMLGFLRNGFMGVDSHLQPYSLVVLAILIAIVFAWRQMRIEHIFFVALLSTAAGILLEPVLGAISPEIAVILRSMGTALFEVVVWTFVIWAVHNSIEALRAAAVCRFCSVMGHLLGNIAVAVGVLVSPTLAEASQTAGMLVIFVYFILLTVLLKNPSLKIPLTVHEAAGLYTKEAPAADSGVAPSATEASDAGTAGGAAAQSDATRADVEIDSTGARNAETAPSNSFSPNDEPGTDGSASDDDPAASAAAEAVADAASAAAAVEAAVASYEERYWTRPCKTIAATYRLTRRETEVLEHLAHGYSLASIEETLCISHNTLKMHVRNLYAKLEVHSRQDVMSMVEVVRHQLG